MNNGYPECSVRARSRRGHHSKISLFFVFNVSVKFQSSCIYNLISTDSIHFPTTANNSTAINAFSPMDGAGSGFPLFDVDFAATHQNRRFRAEWKEALSRREPSRERGREEMVGRMSRV